MEFVNMKADIVNFNGQIEVLVILWVWNTSLKTIQYKTSEKNPSIKLRPKSYIT
jgi:hypothetical protein